MTFTELQSSSCTCMLMKKAVPCVYFQSVLIHPFYYNNKLNALILVLLNKEVLLPLLRYIFKLFFHTEPIKILLLKNGLSSLKYIKKILLFTLGSIKSTYASGAEEMLETNNLN